MYSFSTIWKSLNIFDHCTSTLHPILQSRRVYKLNVLSNCIKIKTNNIARFKQTSCCPKPLLNASLNANKSMLYNIIRFKMYKTQMHLPRCQLSLKRSWPQLEYDQIPSLFIYLLFIYYLQLVQKNCRISIITQSQQLIYTKSF